MKRILLIVTGVLALSLFSASDAMAKKSQPTGLKGKIVSISGNGTITIQVHQKGGGGGQAPMTIHTDANTTVEINGVSGKHVNDLQAGDRVVIAGDATTAASDIQAKRHGHGKRKPV
jgi:NADPH:quinone reductase-like Zn-dependent oxidoreductase